MDRFVTVTDAADDLTSAKAILIVHVMHRGYNLGTFVGLGTALVITTAKAIRGTASPSPFSARLLASAARGSVAGLAFGALAVGGRMWNKELIEWQDRSWRLLHHAGQTQTDYYSAAGLATGAAAGTLIARQRQTQAITTTTGARLALLRPRTVILGSAAIGSAVGIVTMIGLRVFTKQKNQNE